MTQAQFFGLACLLLFGLLYDLLVASALRERESSGGFTAAFVILGVLITLFVLFLDSQHGVYSAEIWLMLTLAHFCASGFGMTIGSWQRR